MFTIKIYNCFPRNFPKHPYRKKFQKFDKIVRNIFRGIFLQRKFPPGNFPEVVEVKHLFTAVSLYF